MQIKESSKKPAQSAHTVWLQFISSRGRVPARPPPQSGSKSVLLPWPLNLPACPHFPTKQPQKNHNAFQRSCKMTLTSQCKSVLPLGCRTLQSFILSHEMLVSPTVGNEDGGSYLPPSAASRHYTWLWIHHSQDLFAAQTIWPIYSHICQLWSYKLTLSCAVDSPPCTIHGGHLNQLVSSHSSS